VAQCGWNRRRLKSEIRSMTVTHPERREVTYSSDNGHKVINEVFEAKTAGADRVIRSEKGIQAHWIVTCRALASTFTDGMGRAAEIVFYDDEHVQISNSCASMMSPANDQRGTPNRVARALSPVIPDTTGGRDAGRTSRNCSRGRIFSKEAVRCDDFKYGRP